MPSVPGRMALFVSVESGCDGLADGYPSGGPDGGYPCEPPAIGGGPGPNCG